MKNKTIIIDNLFVFIGVYAEPFDMAKDKRFRGAKARLNACVFLVFLIGAFAGQAQNLQSYIKEAEANNPDIQTFELRYNIAQEKVNEVNTLPNTTISAGY